MPNIPFTVGAIVVCCDADFTFQQKEVIPFLPVLGEVYTVNQILLTPQGFGVILDEIKNPNNIAFYDENSEPIVIIEPSFGIQRFEVIGHVADIINLFTNEDDNEYQLH